MSHGVFVCPTCERQYDDLKIYWSRPKQYGNNTCAKCGSADKKCRAAQMDSRATINAVS